QGGEGEDPMNGSVVVDASLAVKWLVNEVHTEKAFALARSWAQSDVQPVAPYLMPVEVSNALHRRVVRGDVSLEAATRLLDGLLDAGIELREPAGLHRRAIELAAQLRHDAAYDAHYLALAESLDCELWTADEQFYRSAIQYFSRIHWVGQI
ncbi:MAG: type II toxin-antitoxin system VapC family toxin, partial [Dehalococcoidia bacterium]